MHKNTAYNIFFPIWFLLIFPLMWIVVLPVNFLVDTLVLLITFKAMKLSGIKQLYWRSIWMVWGFGFLADLVGAALLFPPNLADIFIPSISTWVYDNLVAPLAFNPYTNPFAIVYMLIAIAISGVGIYFFNLKISLRALEITSAEKKHIALMLALFTAPYVLAIPTQWLYAGL